MSVTTDIVQSWRQPRGVISRHLARGRSEPFAFSLLVAFLVLAFIAQWPRLSRQTVLTPEEPLVPLLVATGLALLATIPLFYALAAGSHLVARAIGGKGGWYGARLALFAALLAVAPLMLLQGLVAGMIGPGPGALVLGGLVLAGFGWIWVQMLIEVAR